MTLQDSLRVEKALPFRPVAEIAPVRRFELADFHSHPWVFARLAKAYPEMGERYVAGWLRGLIYNNDYCFLFQEHAVGLAALERAHGLQPRPLIVEKFVFAHDPTLPAHLEAAAQMYDYFMKWAKTLGCDRMVVGQLTDVPKDTIKEVCGSNLLEVKAYHVRVPQAPER